MKRLIIILFVSLLAHSGLFAQSRHIDDPVYFGMMLIDQPNADKMEEICDYYELQEQPEVDGFRVFRHSDGTELRFRTYEIGSKYQPVIKVYTNKNEKDIAQILNDAGYHKDGAVYYKGTKYEMRRTKCTVTGTGSGKGPGKGKDVGKDSGSGRKTLTFEKEYNTL